VSENPVLAVALALLLLPLLLVAFLPPLQAGGPVLPVSATRINWPTYTVQAGDTLSSIAQRTGVPVDYLVASNDVDPSRLRPGQQLLLPSGGVVHTVRTGQTVADLARTYGVLEGTIRSVNGLSGEPAVGTRIFIPAPAVIPQATALALGRGIQFAWPARGAISSPFGPRIHPVYRVPSFHAGIDVVLAEGTNVYAAAPGRVVTAGWEGGYGILVVLDHGDGYSTWYGHLSQLLVSVGQFVEIGQAIARSGNTGLSTGPHLHFEVRHDGVALDPLLHLP
jgi:murein DD-endopeptidase MepM/ murein hydrolase activator NlpD